MEQDPKPARASPETRLLMLTIGVCVIVLLLLSRLRFPEPPPVVATAVPPLERLAARASYDALAADIERVEAMISPSLVMLRTAQRNGSTPTRVRDVLTPADVSHDVRHVAALRINADTALAVLSAGVRIEGIVGGAAAGGTAEVVAMDPVRRIGRVTVPEGPARPIVPIALASLRTPVYVVAVEGTQAGVTLRPIFLGRGDRFMSTRWARPLLPLGGTAVAPGALLFSLQGEFVGCVVVEDGAPAIAGASDVLDVVERLASGVSPGPAAVGIVVQPLTPDLAAALGAEHGVVVTEVDADGPASGILRPGDVITALDGAALGNPERFLLDVASRQTGESVALAIIRSGEPSTATLVLATADDRGPVPDEWLAFERLRDGGTRVAAAGQTGGYMAAGLQVGDIIVHAGDLDDPTPLQLRRLIDAAPPDAPVVLTIRREGEQRVIAVRPHSR